MAGPAGRSLWASKIDWLDIEASAAEVDRGRRADVIVVTRPIEQDNPRMRDSLHAALFETDSPVPVIPPGFAGCRHCLDERRARGESSARLHSDPAESSERSHLARQSSNGHGGDSGGAHIPEALRTVPDGTGAAAERILQAAHQISADLLVMGAFSRGEWHELMFGGVTRTMLAQPDSPLFMHH